MKNVGYFKQSKFFIIFISGKFNSYVENLKINGRFRSLTEFLV